MGDLHDKANLFKKKKQTVSGHSPHLLTKLTEPVFLSEGTLAEFKGSNNEHVQRLKTGQIHAICYVLSFDEEMAR